MKFNKFLDVIKSMKFFLYFTSIAPVLLAFFIDKLNNLLIFTLLLLLVISAQLMMNISMDILDFKNNVKVRNENTFFPIGPYSIAISNFKLKNLEIVLALSILFVILDGLIILILTKEYILIFFGIFAIFLSILYIITPISLYRRGFGEISTFFNFGPLPLIGSLLAFHYQINIQYFIISVFLGFFASAIRYLHHIPEDDPNSFRVKNFKLIYSLIIVLGILLPILFGFLLLIILIVPVIWHIIRLPEDIESISQKTYQIVLLHILGTLLIIIQLYI